MKLALASFDSQLIKGEILQQYRGQISPIKTAILLYNSLFHSVPLGDEDFKHHSLATWRFSLLEKKTLELPLLESPISWIGDC